VYIRTDVDSDTVKGEIRADHLVFAGVKTGAHVKPHQLHLIGDRARRADGSPPRPRRCGVIGFPI
jgi:hypothetical protein